VKGIVYESKGRVRAGVVADPHVIEPTDAVVRITLSGICGTDLHLIGGDFTALEPGAVVGHEFVGDVVEVGSAVRSVRAGDHVCGSDFSACGACRWCARGEHWECEERHFFGSGRAFGPSIAGAQAEFIRVPFADVTLAVVPPGCSDEAAILVCDNLPTGWAAIDFGGLEPGETVAVVGGGPIGQLTALCAQTAGAAAVVIVEPSEVRRRFASDHGSIAVDAAASSALVLELTGGDGADLVVEAAGRSATLEAAFSLVRKRGRIVSVAAHSADAWPLPLARAFANEISLRFAIGDSIRYRRKLFAMIASGILDPVDVVETRVSFADAPLAYEQMATQRVMKAVIDPRL
jgi:threonine dehydrogenase-like Zn-dependent dehydrogenase